MQALEAKDELQMEVQLYKKNGELNFETGRKTVKVKYFNSAHKLAESSLIFKFYM